eukprot:UN06367
MLQVKNCLIKIESYSIRAITDGCIVFIFVRHYGLYFTSKFIKKNTKCFVLGTLNNCPTNELFDTEY